MAIEPTDSQAHRPPIVALGVEPVIDLSVRKLCVEPYYGHPKGCPNYNTRPSCPPQAPLLSAVLDLNRTVWAIWNKFNLAEHVARMKKKHSEWSIHQLRCVLYWQGRARKQLREKIARFADIHSGLIVLTCPEAMGVNVTETMKQVGIALEWPVEHYAYQVALIGHRKRKSAKRRRRK